MWACSFFLSSCQKSLTNLLSLLCQKHPLSFPKPILPLTLLIFPIASKVLNLQLLSLNEALLFTYQYAQIIPIYLKIKTNKIIQLLHPVFLILKLTLIFLYCFHFFSKIHILLLQLYLLHSSTQLKQYSGSHKWLLHTV